MKIVSVKTFTERQAPAGEDVSLDIILDAAGFCLSKTHG